MLHKIRTLLRLGVIITVLLKYRLDVILFELEILKPIQFLAHLFPKGWFYASQNTPPGERLRKALEDLGPLFVKFGQLLSTRSDLLPEAVLKELAKLQDRVPPFDGQWSKKLIEDSLGKPIEQLFLTFDTNPLASASIAQVHAATTLTNQAVVVKVLRPDILKTIQHDLSLLRTIARLLERYSVKARRFKPKAMVYEFKKTLLDELDLMREAANASQLRRNFSGSTQLYIPEVHWSHTNGHVLTLERIYGIPIADTEQLQTAGVNLKRLAETGIEIFFTQVFRDCFFHADMHPGNLMVSYHHPENPQYLAVDFGIIGTLSRADQRYLAENFLAFFKRDYRKVAELHIESGWVPKHIRVDEFESAIRTVSEPIFERPLKEISFAKTLLRLFQTAERFEMNIQPQLLLLQKTLFSIEGLGRQLYPDLDLWHTAKPFLENWMKQQMGMKSVFRKLKESGPYWIERMPEIPTLLFKALDTLVQLDDRTNAALQPPQSVDAHPHTTHTTSLNRAFWKGSIYTALFLAATSGTAYAVWAWL